jgi:hypothetical protein
MKLSPYTHIGTPALAGLLAGVEGLELVEIGAKDLSVPLGTLRERGRLGLADIGDILFSKIMQEPLENGRYQRKQRIRSINRKQAIRQEQTPRRSTGREKEGGEGISEEDYSKIW